jgi:transcriptional regulator with XRE-family HTH domain
VKMTISCMKFADALDITLKHFKISAKELAAKSGVAESSISRYRRGERDIQADSLERLIAALPSEARNYLYFNCLIRDIDDAGIATLLQAIAIRLKSNPEKSLSPESFALTSV